MIPDQGVDAPDRYTRRVRIDLNRLDLVMDGSTNGRIFIGSRVRDVAEFSMSLSEKGWLIRGTTFADALKKAGERASGDVTKSENALVSAAHSQLVQIPAVQMALSPLRSILVRLDDVGRLSLKDLRRSRKSPEQIDKYIKVLEGVEYLRIEKGDLVPGQAFPSGTREEHPLETYDRMLAQVLTREMTYLRFVLGFSQIVGYLRWANALYLTAWRAERQELAMRVQDLETKYGLYYGGLHRSGIEITGQIQRVIDARVITRKNEFVTGNEEITPKFFNAAAQVLPQPS